MRRSATLGRGDAPAPRAAAPRADGPCTPDKTHMSAGSTHRWGRSRSLACNVVPRPPIANSDLTVGSIVGLNDSGLSNARRPTTYSLRSPPRPATVSSTTNWRKRDIRGELAKPGLANIRPSASFAFASSSMRRPCCPPVFPSPLTRSTPAIRHFSVGGRPLCNGHPTSIGLPDMRQPLHIARGWKGSPFSRRSRHEPANIVHWGDLRRRFLEIRFHRSQRRRGSAEHGNG